MKKSTFDIVYQLMGISPLEDNILGYKVSLEASLVWAIRELRLHQMDSETVELNIKLDGRPLFGMLNYIEEFTSCSLYSGTDLLHVRLSTQYLGYLHVHVHVGLHNLQLSDCLYEG